MYKLKYLLLWFLGFITHLSFAQVNDSLQTLNEVSILYNLYPPRGITLNKEELVFTRRSSSFNLWIMRRQSYYETIRIKRVEISSSAIDSLRFFLRRENCLSDLRDVPMPMVMGKTTLYIHVKGCKDTIDIEQGLFFSTTADSASYRKTYQLEIDKIDTLVGHINSLIPKDYNFTISPPKEYLDYEFKESFRMRIQRLFRRNVN
jgi:hypothetical protein